MINKIWCDPRNISILSHSCLPHLEHLSLICRPFYLPREFSSIVITAAYIPPQADTSLALSKLHDELSGYINKANLKALTKPTSIRSCRTFTNMYPVQLEDRIHCIIATLSLRMPTKQATETVTIRTIRIDRTIRDAVNHRTAAYNAGLLPGNMSEYKASSYALRRAVRAAKL